VYIGFNIAFKQNPIVRPSRLACHGRATKQKHG